MIGICIPSIFMSKVFKCVIIKDLLLVAFRELNGNKIRRNVKIIESDSLEFLLTK